MAPEPNKDAHEGGYSPHMTGVALAILMMGVSLALIVALWLGIGHLGPNYSATVMQEQQAALREQYGLPAQETSTAQLEVPPSLRDLSNETGNATNTASQSASNATSSGNQTAAPEAPSSSTEVSIVQGAVSKTNDAYDPNPIQIKAGDKVTWTNIDSTPHTATSGQDAKQDGMFDSSVMAKGKSFSFTFEEAGEYPYFCTLHPNMVGTVSVS